MQGETPDGLKSKQSAGFAAKAAHLLASFSLSSFQNISPCIRSLAARFSVIHFHFANIPGYQSRLLLQLWIAHSDLNQRTVHGMPYTVQARMNLLFNHLQTRFKGAIGQLLVLHGEMREKIPTRLTDEFMA